MDGSRWCFLRTDIAWCIVGEKPTPQVYSLPWKWWSVLINSPGVIFKSLGCSSCATIGDNMCTHKDQHVILKRVFSTQTLGVCIQVAFICWILYNWLAFIFSKFVLMPSEFHGTLPRSICPTVTFSLSYSWIIHASSWSSPNWSTKTPKDR